MSYSAFTEYSYHPPQLTLMTGNLNSSVTTSPSPCCSVKENQSSNTSTNTSDMNGDVNSISHSELSLNTSLTHQIPSNSSLTHQIPSNSSLAHQIPSNSSVCTLTSPYESRLINSYQRLSGFYGPSYSDQNSFYPSGTFYSSFGHPYDLKEANSGNWSSIPQTTCYSYDPTLYNPYGDRYSAMDSAARRKNATRETTNTLKAWLYEHRKNPYPTKGEKIMLAIITKMTLTQVSTWFANARRRLKKENKMTWEPRNKNDGHDDSDDKESCKDSEDNSSSEIGESNYTNVENKVKEESDITKSKVINNGCQEKTPNHIETTTFQMRDINSENNVHFNQFGKPLNLIHHQQQPQPPPPPPPQQQQQQQQPHQPHQQQQPPQQQQQTQRPKIWSLAQTATSESPPLSGRTWVNPIGITEWPAFSQGPDILHL